MNDYIQKERINQNIKLTDNEEEINTTNNEYRINHNIEIIQIKDDEEETNNNDEEREEISDEEKQIIIKMIIKNIFIKFNQNIE